jgi:hypothetical protein
MPKLKSTLPKGDANGLGRVAAAMVRDPHPLHVIIAIVDCPKTEIDHDLDEVIPVIRVRRIEGILPEDLSAAERLMRRSLEHRKGFSVLPLDLEDDIQSAFGRVDPDEP